MGFLTATILSGFVYDILKRKVLVSVEAVKVSLKDWVVDEAVIPTLVEELNKLNISNELSETAIEKRINQSIDLMAIIKTIKPTQNTTTITQNHSGTGDNIGRDKILN